MASEVKSDMRKGEQAAVATEQTRPGPIYTPAVDIFENDDAITLLADMPGVRADAIKIDLREDMLTLTGRVTAPEQSDEVDVLREYPTGTFVRQFSLSEMIDQARIEARLNDGVLRLVLPKIEKVKPRQIAVKTE